MRSRRLFGIALVCMMIPCAKTVQIDCTSCLADTYSEKSASTTNTCVSCAGNSTSAVASGSASNCTCDSGFSEFRKGSNLVCEYSNLSDGEILDFQVFIEKSLNLSTSLVKSGIDDFTKNINIINKVQIMTEAYSDTDTYDIRLLVPHTVDVALHLVDVYRLLVRKCEDANSAVIMFVDGKISLRKTLPLFELGDRIFLYENRARTINQLIFTKTTQTIDQIKLSPKNLQIVGIIRSVFVVRSACTDLSCECQPSPQDYCDSNLRTLT